MRALLIMLFSLLVVITVLALRLMGKPQHVDPMDGCTLAQINTLLPHDVTKASKISIYTSSTEAYNNILSDIDKACYHVHLLFHKYEPDAVGQQMGDMLLKKQQQGVQTRLMYDWLMCLPWGRYYRYLSRRGVSTAAFGKMELPMVRKRDYYRNHRKLVVVDGRIAWLGGMNIAERYIHGLGWGCWRDTMIRIEGPAVSAVQQVFIVDWYYSTGQLLNSPSYFPKLSVANGIPVRIITSGPIGDGEAIMHFCIQLLDCAKHYIYFQSPYFIPPTPLCEALFHAARRGVDVRVMLPPRGDRGEVTQWVSRSFFTEALEAGVKIALYQPGFLHAKTIVCDDEVGVVGSCNIDPRSYLLCEEIAAVIESHDYACQMKTMFVADEALSHYINLDQWRNRPYGHKVKEHIARLVASQL